MRALLRGHWQLLLLVAAIALLWRTPLVIPLKLLVVFLHELGHVVAVLLTGGEVLDLTLDPMQGGAVTSRGGNRFISLSAGYLGSLLIGVALFMAAVRTRADRVVLSLLGLTLLAVTVLYIRSPFALVFGAGTGAAMLLAAKFLPRDVNDLMLRVIGLVCMVYVPLDIYSDTIARGWLHSDARMLAEEFGGTPWMWGGLWLAASAWVIWMCLRRGLGAQSNIRLR
ncbi:MULTISPECIES: M50 family metallopeptidase [unclassified Roseovarius]|uniref:M50 family metallopeptidase n=1 Tax=unclassified Roseovarius TaxID=2614913 RepID=UPI00273D64DA|nr:M50 family metallopeptidase [Roseovarius sp. MMSF_3350]